MSSPESMDEFTGDSNSRNVLDEKSRDSIVSRGSKSSKVSGDQLEPNDAVLDFEVDAPEAHKRGDEDDEDDEKNVQIHDELSKEAVDDDSKDGAISDDSEKEPSGDKEEAVKKPKARSSDLEDGEVTDSDEDGGTKPTTNNGSESNKSERPPVCRFFTRGQCTWGTQCRFIHPGIPTGASSSGFHHHAPHPRIFNGPGGHFPPPSFPPMPVAPVETAWERGLRNAKELLKEASRRREEDPAFEDRKLHQGLQGSPVREVPIRFSPSPSPPLRSKLYGSYEKHRDLHRSVSPLNIDRWKEERHAAATKPRSGAGDSWRDPWMRAKSPGRNKPRRRGRSSTSRGSSSASSRSSFSSSKGSSRSRSRSRDKRRPRPNYNNKPPRQARQRYPSERTRPQFVASPSPSRYRGKIAPPAGPGRLRHHSSSSSSSSSRSRSPPNPQRKRYSRSKSPDSAARRQRQPSPSRTVAPQIRMNLIDKSRKLTTKRAFSISPSPPRSPKQARVSPSPPPRNSDSRDASKKKPEKKSDAIKREELMKQLRAVEDAIAKKKSKT